MPQLAWLELVLSRLIRTAFQSKDNHSLTRWNRFYSHIHRDICIRLRSSPHRRRSFLWRLRNCLHSCGQSRNCLCRLGCRSSHHCQGTTCWFLSQRHNPRFRQRFLPIRQLLQQFLKWLAQALQIERRDRDRHRLRHKLSHRSSPSRHCTTFSSLGNLPRTYRASANYPCRVS